MTVRLGDTVLFALAEVQVQNINRVRQPYYDAGGRPKDWPRGVQGHVGSEVKVGELVSMKVTRVLDGGRLNGRLELDGSDVVWVVNVAEGTTPGTWRGR